MRQLLIAVCLMVGGLIVVSGLTPAMASGNTASETDFHVGYGSPGRFMPLAAPLRQKHYLERLARDLDQDLDLPVPLTLVTAQCGQANAFYRPDKRYVVLCYELMEQMGRDLSSRTHNDQAVAAGMLAQMSFVWLHELGHALIHVLDLPVVGGEEDAADQMAVLFLVGMNNRSAYQAIILAAGTQYRQGQQRALTNSRFANEHSLGQQRYYAMMCLLYGSDPHRHRTLVSDGYITKRQARRCPTRYRKVARSWNALLEDHLNGQAPLGR